MTDSLPTGDAGGLTVADERLILSGLIAKNSDGTPRVGVFPNGSTVLVRGRASMGYEVLPFKAATSRTGTGVELVANDALVVVTTTAAPGANSRIDVIWVRPQFSANADAGNVPILGVTQGTAASVPTKPAIPAGALELATATILSTTTTTGTAVITQTYTCTAAAGGAVVFRNDADALAWSAVDGASAYSASSGNTFERTNGAWKRKVSFRTFNLARSTMTDGITFFQVPTEDTAKDTEPAFSYSYNGANGALTFEAGIYLLQVRAHAGGVTTGTSFVQIKGTVQGVLPGGRGAVSINADPVMACSASFRADGSEGVIVDIQKVTGGSSDGSGVLNVIKISGL